jgi:hypothetical protein
LQRERLARVAVVTLFGAFVAALRVTPLYDPDYFWHLRTGQYVLAHRAVPAVDPFSHTFAGRPWHYVDWLADMLMYGLWRAGGHALAIVAFALAGGLAVALALGHALCATGARVGAALVTGALVAAAVVFRVTPRPQTLTFALLALELWVLESARRRPRLLTVIPPLITLWQNLHSSAMIAWLVLGVFATGATVDRARGRAGGAPVRAAWLTTGAGALALLAAPKPLDRLAAGWAHLGDPRVAAVLPEWSAIWQLGAPLPWAVALALLVLCALLALVRVPRPPLDRVLAAAGLTVMAARTIRFVPLAAIALAPLALAGIASVLERLSGRARGWVAGAVALACAGLLVPQRKPFGTGVDASYFPVDAARWVQRHDVRGRMYNDFFFGGYLLWSVGERHPVFIDGRSLALYGIDFVADVSNATPPTLARLLPRYDVGFGVVYSDSRLAWFQRREGWSLVYFDDTASVVVRDRDNPDLAARAGYRRLHPSEWAGDVDALARDPAAIPEAAREAARAVAEAPQSALARVMVASVALAAGDAGRAEAAIAEALALRPGFVPALRARLVGCVRANDRACVCAQSAVVLARAPQNAYARRARAAFGCAQ